MSTRLIPGAKKMFEPNTRTIDRTSNKKRHESKVIKKANEDNEYYFGKRTFTLLPDLQKSFDEALKALQRNGS